MSSDAKKEYLNKTKIEFYKEIKKYQLEFKPSKEVEGFASTAIVGEKNYPNLKIHNVSNENQNNSFFNSSDIVKKDYSEIIKLKARNIFGTTDSVNIRKVDEKINEELSNIYKSKKPINIASEFEKELRFDKVALSGDFGILGSKNSLINIKATENTKTSEKIEKYTSSDIKAKEAIISLYESNANESQITNLLSLGNFGIQINKKMVPTKWAISAFDQTIEKYLFEKIKNYKQIEKYEIYNFRDKGNDFVIVLFPNIFSGEVVESFPGAIERDFINFENKLDKESPATAGGYYATKLGIYEHLRENKKFSAFISLRVISEYELPLGVVFVRETVRLAMKNKKNSFNSQNELETYLRFNYPKHFEIYKNSKVLKEIKRKRITDY